MKKSVGPFLLAAGVCFVAMASAQTSTMAPVEGAMVQAVDAEAPAATALLEKLVNINSGTMNLAGVGAVKDGVGPRIEALGVKEQWGLMASLVGRAGGLGADPAWRGGAGEGRNAMR